MHGVIDFFQFSATEETCHWQQDFQRPIFDSCTVKPQLKPASFLPDIY